MEQTFEEYLEGLDIIQLRAAHDELQVRRDNAVARYQAGDKLALSDVQKILHLSRQVNAKIYEYLNADEIKAAEERQAKEQAEREKALKAEQERQAKIKAERELKRQAEEQEKLEKKVRAKEKISDDTARLKNHKPKTNFECTIDDVINALKVQIVPSTECIEMNDKLSKNLFSLSKDTFKKLLSGKKRGIVEKKARTHKGKHKDAIVSWYTVKNAEGYDDETPFDEFDRAVLGIFISEAAVGNTCFTVNIIFRALIGKPGEVGIVPFKNQRDAIVNSIQRLRNRDTDFIQVFKNLEEMKYLNEGDNKITSYKTKLLPADIAEGIINGQAMDGIIVLNENSPLFDIANLKSQIIRYPHALLDVPNLNNTPRIIALKKYVMRRICEIKLHKQMIPTITFADVFEKCRMEDSLRSVKQDARNAIKKLFEHLKENNFITDFELVRNPQTQKFVSVKFTY